jgi:hypothetical protein
VRIENGRQIVAARAALSGNLEALNLLALAMHVQHRRAIGPDDALRARWLDAAHEA